MTTPSASSIAIACGGTGGHLFPGLAVAEQLARRGATVTLLISSKEVDRQGVRTAPKIFEIVTLPAVGLSRGRALAFVRGFVRSYRAARRHFRFRPPHAALAMGGFTSAPPVLAAKRSGAPTFLHESNSIPGRANRWLSWFVDQAFVGFPQAETRLHNRRVTVTGTPVRPQFHARDPGACRMALGLDPDRPVLLVTGGSQGAGGINEIIAQTLPLLSQGSPRLQLLHLAGPNDTVKIRQACAALNLRAVVHSFLAEMELALGAATVAVSRAGASSLAELAAMRVPAVLVPYPAATDNHQFCNARAFEQTGAARLLEQNQAAPAALARLILELIDQAAERGKIQAALARWHTPEAAGRIAEALLNALCRSADSCVRADNRGQDICGAAPSRSGTIERHDLSAA
jgi:UDP-N-acetylglucosamine--N-acetylmuramyl-(pentapeptide) pyrophosphoryl-undecaprenol N-acetylglucosamine transferase